MYEIIYTSTAAEPMGVPALADILNKAREKNERLDVTGMLLYKKGTFLQVLEGGEETVLDLYGVIKRDERHHTVITLSEELLEDGRNFGDWQMGFKHFGDVFPGEEPEGDMYEGYSAFMNKGFDADDFTASPSYARDALLHFKESNL